MRGVCLFTVHDQEPAWRHKPKEPGVYSTTAWVPGDLLAEGTHFVGVGVSTMAPLFIHFYESDARRLPRCGWLPGRLRPRLISPAICRAWCGRSSNGRLGTWTDLTGPGLR